MGDSGWQDTPAAYRKYLEQSGLSPTTARDYVRDIRELGMWLAAMGKESLLETACDDIRAYPSALVTDKGYSAATVNRRIHSIRKFYRHALESRLAEEDLSLGIKLLWQPKSVGNRSLSEAEIERLLEAVQNGTESLVKRDCAIVQLVLQTGIRVGELTSLEISDVSLSEDRSAIEVRGRGNSMGREIPPNNSARKALMAHLNERPEEETDWVFLSRRGGPFVRALSAEAG